MILEIQYYKGDVFLTGKNISELSLRKQIEYVHKKFDRENDNFTELLCRCFNWEILSYDGRYSPMTVFPITRMTGILKN